ncbi:MAG: hypothetical protein K6G50_00475 [bacterium]|nr:hypothetical protein [bacterium]
MSTIFPPIDDSFPRLIPAFGKLVKLLSECADGGVALDCAFNEFQECDSALGGMLEKFMNAIRLKEFPKDQGPLLSDLLQLFAGASHALVRLSEAMTNNDAEAAANIINHICIFLNKIEENNLILRDACKNANAFSEVPVINSVLTAGNAIIEGYGEWETLEERLGAIIPEWNKLLSDNQPDEITRHDEALDKLANVVNEHNSEGLAEAMEEYKTTGEALVSVQDSIDNADSGYLCPMCGAALTVGAKTCPSCKTRLPEFLAEKTPATDAAVQVELPPYVQKLFDASEQLREDPNKFPAFKKAVDEMRRRAASSQKKLDKINVQALGENMTQDEREALEGSYDVVRSGLDKFLRAIDAFDSLELPVDEFHLQCALEVVVSAVEDMRRAGSIVQGYMV